MKKLSKFLSALLVVAMVFSAGGAAFTVNAAAVNTFTVSTDYEDGVIEDNATQVKFKVKFDVGNSYGFVGGDFALELPDEMNKIALVKTTANTKLNGGALNADLIAVATKNNTVRFIAEDAKTSLKSITFEITINVISSLERGKDYTIKVSAPEGYFKDDQTQNEEIKFDTDTKSVSVNLRREVSAKPQKPALQGATDTTVTLFSISGYEYKCNNGTWQTSNVFTGLQPNTRYSFYQRVAETSAQFASASSDATIVTTDKSKAPKPAAPTLHSKTKNSVTLTKIDGYEYKRGNGDWQTSNVFTGLNANTEYQFYQRKAETDTHYASDASDRLIVTTEAVVPNVPNKITSSKYTVSSNTVSKIAAGTTVSTLLNGINEKQYCKVYSGNNAVSGDKTVGSGMTVKLMDGNTVKATYTIIVTGDVNGDGKITAVDYVNVKFAVLGKQSLSGAYKTAADVNGDSKVTAVDYVNIKFKVLGKTQITPR